jgi:hypothetical protein
MTLLQIVYAEVTYESGHPRLPSHPLPPPVFPEHADPIGGQALSEAFASACACAVPASFLNLYARRHESEGYGVVGLGLHQLHPLVHVVIHWRQE